MITAGELAGIAALALVAGAASWFGTGRLIAVLGARQILDHPNERSSHHKPVPRGGGIAVVGALVPIWMIVALVAGMRLSVVVVLAASIALAALSWRDDRGGLPVGLRIAAQGAAVALALATMPEAWGLFGDWLPAWLGAAIIGFAWLWFVNLFNFMDGIDGLAGGEAASIGIGVAVVALYFGLDWSLAAYGAAAAAAALGFLRWNWHPAKIFMGDVGSVPLGFLLGFLLLKLALAGHAAAALILPAYFLADATVTLLRRALRREKIWQAHRSHFYQRAVAAGLSHAHVSALVMSANACLIGTALLAAPGRQWIVLAVAAGIAAALLSVLARAR